MTYLSDCVYQNVLNSVALIKYKQQYKTHKHLTIKYINNHQSTNTLIIKNITKQQLLLIITFTQLTFKLNY